MVINHLKNFSRQVFVYYDKYPLMMNSIAGGVVYIAGEVFVQVQSSSLSLIKAKIDWKKVGEIGTLGSIENGLFMTAWYNFLNKYVGNGISTQLVLTKCLLDQIFFATQQDFLFLALCAYNDKAQFYSAIEEVKKSFLTTWIMDCSLWPLVNFVGFAAVPFKFQPTYMAFVQFFWQIYISSVASNNSKQLPTLSDEDETIEKLFKEIDIDLNGYIDEKELKLALIARGIEVREEEVKQMIMDGDTGVADGKISFEEFKVVVQNGSKLKSAKLWEIIKTERYLDKGAKAVMRRYDDLKKKNDKEIASIKTATTIDDNINNNNSNDNNNNNPTNVNINNGNNTNNNKLSDNTINIINPNDNERMDAIRNASIGFSILSFSAIVRKFVFKI